MPRLSNVRLNYTDDPIELERRFGALTARQMQVGINLVVGRTNREIAELLQLSVKTIDTFRGQVMRRVGVRNNAELCLAAIRGGVLKVPELIHRNVAMRLAEAAVDAALSEIHRQGGPEYLLKEARSEALAILAIGATP